MGDSGRGLALVCGGASVVWDDLHRLREMGTEPDLVIAVNDIGAKFPHIDHWVSLHADRLPGWERDRGGPKTWQTWTHSDPYDLCDNHLPHEGGSSGGYAVTVALHLGCERVVLCGVPLESRYTHYFPGQPFDEADRFRKEWVENGLVDKWMGRVRSMSGWTATMMGMPTREWLNGGEDEHEAAA